MSDNRTCLDQFLKDTLSQCLLIDFPAGRSDDQSSQTERPSSLSSTAQLRRWRSSRRPLVQEPRNTWSMTVPSNLGDIADLVDLGRACHHRNESPLPDTSNVRYVRRRLRSPFKFFWKSSSWIWQYLAVFSSGVKVAHFAPASIAIFAIVIRLATAHVLDRRTCKL